MSKSQLVNWYIDSCLTHKSLKRFPLKAAFCCLIFSFAKSTYIANLRLIAETTTSQHSANKLGCSLFYIEPHWFKKVSTEKVHIHLNKSVFKSVVDQTLRDNLSDD